jgi:glycosyltransferase involved in cell wall biosynthesis
MVRLPLLSRITASWNIGWEVFDLLGSGKFDAVLLYGGPTVGLQTLAAARQRRIPLFFRSIDVLNVLAPHPLLKAATRLIEGMLYRGARGILTVTPHLKKYVETYGVSPSKVEVLPSGVDAEMFSKGPRNTALMEQWGIGPHDRTALFMGTIYRFSGLDRVIAGWREVTAVSPNSKLLIVGPGEDEERLRSMAASAGLSHEVIFTGVQPYSLLPDIIRSVDVCINPFELNAVTQDILPTKLFQYQACGKPIVATPLPGTLPFLTGEMDGILYASLDLFNSALGKLLADPERCRARGERGERVARENYDWKQIVRRMVAYMEARLN